MHSHLGSSSIINHLCILLHPTGARIQHQSYPNAGYPGDWTNAMDAYVCHGGD